MSASNWAICPRCPANLDAERDRARKAAEDAYGKVSAEEYHRLIDSIPYALPPDDEKFRTFREDYEIYGAKYGVIHVSYSGSCAECELSFSFEDERPIPGAVPARLSSEEQA